MNVSTKPDTIQRTFGRAALAAGPRLAIGAADTFVASTAASYPSMAGAMGCVKVLSAVGTVITGPTPSSSGTLTAAGGDIVSAVGLFAAASGAGPASVAVVAAGEAIGIFGRMRAYLED